MERRPKRAVNGPRRTVFVGARVREETKHALDVLALLHREGYSSIIERAIQSIIGDTLEFGGAYASGDDDADGLPTGKNLIKQTWAPEEWLRRLKMSLLAPALLSPAELAFWRGISNEESLWSPSTEQVLDEAERAHLGDEILVTGVPNAALIAQAWEAFKSRTATRKEQLLGPDNVRAA